MAQYQQKTDSREFEVANPDRQAGAWSTASGANATELAIQLWSREAPERSEAITWKTDSVLVFMIADLVTASLGRVAEDSPNVMAAHFDGARQALVAARRIQTSLAEFLACRPGECLGASILMHQPVEHGPTLGSDAVRRALAQAKPGQILLAENVAQSLRDLPGIEFRAVSPLTVGRGQPITLAELIWTAPERVSLPQGSAESAAVNEIPPVGATMMVNSSVQGPARKAPSEAVARTGDLVSGSRTGCQKAVQGPETTRDRARIREDSPVTPDGLVLAPGVEGAEPAPLLTRTRVIVGIVALILVGALVAVLDRPAHVAKLPPTPQYQTGGTVSPDNGQGPVAPPAEAKTPQSPSSDNQPRAQGGVAQPPPTKPDKRLKNKKASSEAKDNSEPPPPVEESGGMTQKDIPALLRMAQQDAGAGNYEKARSEFRKILQLQPSNADAREGLHKLDLIGR